MSCWGGGRRFREGCIGQWVGDEREREVDVVNTGRLYWDTGTVGGKLVVQPTANGGCGSDTPLVVIRTLLFVISQIQCLCESLNMLYNVRLYCNLRYIV